MKCFIYDFETLGQGFMSSPVLGIAALEFDNEVFLSKDPYTYDELLKRTKFMKFDVEEQVKKYNKRIEQETLDWWADQGKEAKWILKPGKDDKPLADIVEFIDQFDPEKIELCYTRGNTFDPMFLDQIFLRDLNEPMKIAWWTIRDTRSFIDALVYGTDMSNKFVLPEWEEKFVAHDPRHDIVVDVLRMQACIIAAYGEDDAK